MSKRTAAVQLTVDNVEEQDEISEQAGEFQVASQDEIQQRVIKKAKRGHSAVQDAAGIFGKLQQSLGSAPSTSSQGAALFKFSSSIACTGEASSTAPLKPGGSMPSIFATQGPSTSSAPISFGSKSVLGSGFSSSSGTGSGSSQFGSGSGIKLKLGSGPSGLLGSAGSGLAAPSPFGSGPHKFGFKTPHTTEYLQQLGSLNQSASEWIGRHVGENPYVDLTPIFRDYEAHLHDIDAKYNVGTGLEARGAQQDVAMASEESSEPRNGSEDSSNAEVLSVSDSTPRDSPDVTSSVHQGVAMPTPPPSSLGGTPTPSDDDSLLSMRAKLFYKKESEFIDLGIGTLKVQSSSNSTVHLLMRNDTSLGTILLNVKVSRDMPVSCSKRCVFVVCPTPNPALSVGKGPVTYLLRVKTAELAEQVLSVIRDNTKA